MNTSRKSLLIFKTGSTIKNFKLLQNPQSKAYKEDKIIEDDIIYPLGEGGSGTVYLAAQTLHENIEILRAIKFFIYRDDIAKLGIHTGPISNEDFLSEVVSIASLSHENLIKIIDAGMYEINNTSIPYLVTEYIKGPTLQSIINREKTKKSISCDPETVIDILIQIGFAIQHLHKHGYSHCDIAPKNIFLNEDEKFKPILGDLGLAKNINNPKSEILISGTKSYMPPLCLNNIDKKVSWDIFKSTYPLWDLWAFSQTGIEFINILDQNKPPYWKKALITCFEECKKGARYDSIFKLLERLQFLRPVNRVPELSASISGKVRKLMPVQALTTSKRVRRLIQHPALLRLSRVPQLSTTIIAFPAAIHTRYEHSLGVMETTRQYLVALLENDEFLEHLSAEKIETALICGLFSNLTRFPMSNLLHEIKFKNRSILSPFSKESLLKDIFNIKDYKNRTLLDLLNSDFPLINHDTIKKILLERKSEFDNEDYLIFSFLNSSLDARVVDFVRRDSLHLGIKEGNAVDLDELLPHLTINNHKLALRMTGVTVAEQIISLRYWLFNRIYWCRPNRAFVAMVRFLIMELFENKKSINRIRNVVLNINQQEFLKFLYKESKSNGRSDLIEIANLLVKDNQNLYRVIFDVSLTEAPGLKPALKQIDSMTHQDIKTLTQKLTKYIEECIEIPSGVFPLLVDLPQEPRANKLGEDIMVVGRNNENIVGLTDISGIVKGVNDSFDKHLRRLRVFIHPNLIHDEMKNSDEIKKEKLKRIEENIMRFFLQNYT